MCCCRRGTCATRTRGSPTVGSPDAPIVLQRGYERAYRHGGPALGRGGNAGGVDERVPAHGGVYAARPVDFGKPLPPLAVKRVDGRDTQHLDGGRPSSINTPLGVGKLRKEVATWASMHYPSPHPRVVRIFDAYLDTVPRPAPRAAAAGGGGGGGGGVVLLGGGGGGALPGLHAAAAAATCNVASIVMEAAPAGRLTVPAGSVAAAKGGHPGAGPAPGTRCVDRPVDLVDHVLTTGHSLTHWQAVHVMAQVLMTLFHMHVRVPQVVHRDVKGDNVIVWDHETVALFRRDPATGAEVLLLPATELYLVKLADFGEARFLRPEEDAVTNVGTDAYKAPEVGRGGPQSPAVDVYSCGVTLFTLMLAAAPFNIAADAGARAQWYERLARGADALPDSPYLRDFQRLTPAAQDAIKAMMAPEPGDRATIAELLAMPLFADARNVFYRVGDACVPLVPVWPA
jgi:hypothetical protein